MAKKLEYNELLKSQRRQGMKKRRFKEANNRCVLCGKSDRLVLHHLTYKRAGNERKKDLVVICNSCHFLQHFHKGKKVATYELEKRFILTQRYFQLLQKSKGTITYLNKKH